MQTRSHIQLFKEAIPLHMDYMVSEFHFALTQEGDSFLAISPHLKIRIELERDWEILISLLKPKDPEHLFLP